LLLIKYCGIGYTIFDGVKHYHQRQLSLGISKKQLRSSSNFGL